MIKQPTIKDEQRIKELGIASDIVENQIHGNASQLIRYFADDPEALAGSEYSYDDDLLPILEQPDWDSIEIHSDSVEVEHFTALEHWIVSPWLGSQLFELDEMVSEIFGLHIWGRQTSGQAIYMDSVIQTIAFDTYQIQFQMEIEAALPF